MTPMKPDQNTPSAIQCVVERGDSSVTSVASQCSLFPLPVVPVTVRAGTLDDVAFMDGLQKQSRNAVGWMPTKSLEGKIALGHVLIAEDAGACVGYCIGNDQYFKRDDVGIIYQMNVVQGRQRSLIGATLLKAQFERSAYGCRLYCCWCAQDLAANKFWEAMGFAPLAFRTGSRTKGKGGTPRVHIFWQRRIRAGDTGDVSRGGTPWWFPSKTGSGSLREDRLVFPIPPDTRWSDAKPILLPGMPIDESPSISGRSQSSRKRSPSVTDRVETAPVVTATPKVVAGGFYFAPTVPVALPAIEKPKREPRTKRKNDPRLVAASRELRDRWLEQVNASPVESVAAKYDVSRVLVSAPTPVTVHVMDRQRLALPSVAA